MQNKTEYLREGGRGRRLRRRRRGRGREGGREGKSVLKFLRRFTGDLARIELFYPINRRTNFVLPPPSRLFMMDALPTLFFHLGLEKKNSDAPSIFLKPFPPPPFTS